MTLEHGVTSTSRAMSYIIAFAQFSILRPLRGRCPPDDALQPMVRRRGSADDAKACLRWCARGMSPATPIRHRSLRARTVPCAGRSGVGTRVRSVVDFDGGMRHACAAHPTSCRAANPRGPTAKALSSPAGLARRWMSSAPSTLVSLVRKNAERGRYRACACPSGERFFQRTGAETCCMPAP